MRDRADVRILFYCGSDGRGELAKLKPGQTVVVHGRCDRRLVWAADPGKRDREHSEVVLDCSLVTDK